MPTATTKTPERLRIGTRGSKLALAQSGQTARLLEQSGIATELVVVKTSGDRLADVSLAKVGGKGLFIKELEEALAEGRVDLAIHSMKDVPAEVPPGFVIAAVSRRADVRDVLVRRAGGSAGSPEASAATTDAPYEAPPTRAATTTPPAGDALAALPAIAALPPGARVGTGSLRRRAQLAALRPDLNVVPLRGNVDTRLRKLEGGELDAVVLAAAGLARLGLDVAAEHLAEDAFLPAPGQGALAIETRADDARVRELVHVLHDPASAAACDAERAFLRELGASCQVPVAAFARVADDGALTLTGLVASLDGTTVLRDVARGRAEQASDVGRALADALVARGARAIIAAAEEAAGRL
ncbi:MAG TPA: hydroxymethylbilane synthase [Candidatus Binatia bacterium]